MKPNKFLLDRLPLVAERFSPEYCELIAVKWGAKDGSYHSARSVIKQLNSKLTEQEVRDIELNFEVSIDKEIEILFMCPYCNTDMQKSGLATSTTGIQYAKSFISSDGHITRETEVVFNRAMFKGSPNVTFSCIACGHNLSENCPIVYFTQNGFNRDSIASFVNRGVRPKHKETARDILEEQNAMNIRWQGEAPEWITNTNATFGVMPNPEDFLENARAIVQDAPDV